MNSDTDKILQEISRCPNVRGCLENPDRPHPCRKIVLRQQSKGIKEHQVPEPWSGDLTKAPLLFLSSNPSINDQEFYPRWSWPESKVRTYFQDRFSKWIRDGLYTLHRDGTYSQPVPFWAEVRNRAVEIYERNVTPGTDYALTEMVHCKSRENYGVPQALEKCADLYLARVLSCSSARIIVALGKKVAPIVRNKFGIPFESRVYGPADVCGRDRYIVFLGQPNSNEARTFDTVPRNTLAKLRKFLST
jgi:hypothetical protein